MFDADTRPEDEVTRCIWQQHSVPSHEDKVACHSDEYDSMRPPAGRRAASERARSPLSSKWPLPILRIRLSLSLTVRASVCLQSAI